MAVKFLMEIGFIFKNDTKYKRIVGGTNLSYTDNLSCLNIVNKNIKIKTKNGDFIFEVKSVDIFSSISGFLNVGLTLYDSIEFDFVNIRDKVYIMS